jgi:hypothetical protein
MNITFTGRYSQNSSNFGINFGAKVDGGHVICWVSKEALQDVNPNARMNEAENQFSTNQAQFENIARNKLLNNQVQEDGSVAITTQDL